MVEASKRAYSTLSSKSRNGGRYALFQKHSSQTRTQSSSSNRTGRFNQNYKLQGPHFPFPRTKESENLRSQFFENPRSDLHVVFLSPPPRVDRLTIDRRWSAFIFRSILLPLPPTASVRTFSIFTVLFHIFALATRFYQVMNVFAVLFVQLVEAVGLIYLFSQYIYGFLHIINYQG